MSARTIALEALKTYRAAAGRENFATESTAFFDLAHKSIAALEDETGEPVAWRKNHKGVIDVRHTYTDNPGDVKKWAELGVTLEPLYTATPPAVPQEPYAWTISGSNRMWFGDYAKDDATAEAACCGGTCEAFPLYRGTP